MVEVSIKVPAAKSLTGDQLHEAAKAATDIYFAVAALGYDMDKTTVEINLRHPADTGRLRVDLNGKYFGVWDTPRKTFVD